MKMIAFVVCFAAASGSGVSQANELAHGSGLKHAASDQVQRPAGSPPTRPPSASLVAPGVDCDDEAKCLAKLGGIATRSGKNLDLKLDNGSTKSFVSTDGCEIAGEACSITSLVGYRPSQRWFVLSAQAYESFASIIVSRRTGETFRIEDASPRFSPDGKRFVVVAVSEQDGINELAIYNARAFPPALEWRHTPKSISTMYDFVGWEGNDHIKLRKTNQNSKAKISWTSTGWKLSPAGR